MTTTVEAPAVARRRRAPEPPNRADLVMRRLLLIRPGPDGTTDSDAQRLFSAGILLSALRCLITYIALPVVTPLVGAAAGVAPIIGIPIAVVALVFDVLGIRRFFLAGHHLRWPITVIYLAVMGMVSYLLVGDILHFV